MHGAVGVCMVLWGCMHECTCTNGHGCVGFAIPTHPSRGVYMTHYTTRYNIHCLPNTTTTTITHKHHHCTDTAGAPRVGTCRAHGRAQHRHTHQSAWCTCQHRSPSGGASGGTSGGCACASPPAATLDARGAYARFRRACQVVDTWGT